MASGNFLRELNEATKEAFKLVPRAIIAVLDIADEWWGLIVLVGFILGLTLYLVGR